MVRWDKYLEWRGCQAKEKRDIMALLQTDEEKGVWKTGEEFSWSMEVTERQILDKKDGTAGRGEFSIVRISLPKPAKLIY